MQLVMFSKGLWSLTIPEAASVIKDIGFSGVDLTVRPGGHVSPETVRQELPKAAKVFKDFGLSIGMITTGITSADDPFALDILEAAAESGIKYVKLGYWTYDGFGTMKSAIDRVARDLDGLEKLARLTGTSLGLHTHSGGYITADPMLLWHLIKDRDPLHIGAYLDPGHMVIEGGDGVWRMALDLLSERLFMVAVKDMKWMSRIEGEEIHWFHKMYPLGQGAVPWREFFGYLQSMNFEGPVSIHSEYIGSHSFRDMNTSELVFQTRLDMEYLHRVFEEIGA